MEKIGLDTAHEAFRTGLFRVEIHGDAEEILEKKLEFHEARQGWAGAEFNQEIDIIGLGIATSCRAKHPQSGNAECAQFTASALEGLNDGLFVFHILILAVGGWIARMTKSNIER
jgi:hypothetical protein